MTNIEFVITLNLLWVLVVIALIYLVRKFNPFRKMLLEYKAENDELQNTIDKYEQASINDNTNMQTITATYKKHLKSCREAGIEAKQKQKLRFEELLKTKDNEIKILKNRLAKAYCDNKSHGVIG